MTSAASPSLESALAVPRTPLKGRATDIAAITRWLGEGARLVVIAGPVGIGKTRVALEVARASDVATEVAWVACAGVREMAGFCDAVAGALGLLEEDGAGEPAARIGRALRSRGDLLLVIDGFDALAANASATLAGWLRAAPELVVLVASCERTRLSGEVVHELGPLPEAPDLFVACAQRIRAGFAPEGAEKELVASIARELEGVPLAIELAAARMSVMAPRAILHRLKSGAKGVHDALDRALDNAWSGLTQAEQRVLAGATIFQGGFTLDAAEAVLDDALEKGTAMIDVIAALRDKSLLFSREDFQGETRLDAYRPIRAFAARKLADEANARGAIEAKHAAYFAAFAATLNATRDAHSSSSRARILAERDNLLAVIERVARGGPVSARAAEPALRALLVLAPLLFARGPLRAYEVLVDPAIASTRGSGADPSLVAEVLLVRGALHRHRGAASKGARDLVQALGIARTLANTSLEARATFELGHALDDAGDATAAEDHFRRAAKLFATARDRREEGRAHAALAQLLTRASREHDEEAQILLDRALAAHADDPDARADDLRMVGALALARGRLAAARSAIEESLALAPREVDGREGRSAALARMELGVIAQRAGDRLEARTSFERAAATFADLGFEALSAIAEGHVGVVAHQEGKLAEAETRLATACAALSELSRGAAASLFAEHLQAIRDRKEGAIAPDDALLVGASGAWFRPAKAARVGLERRIPLARIAERLAVERLERPGAAVASRALQDAAWPGEKIQAAAGAHRVRVAISTLRKLGFPIVSLDDGYAIDPSTRLVRA